MDFFGIGAAVKGAVRIYFQSAICTGRSTQLMASLKPGDRVVFRNGDELKWFEHACRDRKIEGVEFQVIPPKDVYHRIYDRGTPKGRLIFDHSWLEEFYLLGIEDMNKTVARLEREFGGWSEAHEETRGRAREIARWDMP